MTPDKWILKTVSGAYIEIEDLIKKAIAKLHRKNFVLNRN